MKSFKPFGPSLGRGKLSKNIINIINNQIDKSIINKKNNYSSKLVSQIKNEIKFSNNFKIWWKYKNDKKKNYIDKEGIKGPMLILNRGYGVGSYKFNYCEHYG